jgi:hypothetical protein
MKMDAVDEVLDAQKRFLETFVGLQRSGEALQQMKTVVDQAKGAQKQLDAARAEAAETRQRAAAVLEKAKADADDIRQHARANAEEITARANQVRTQLIAEGHAERAKIVAELKASTEEFSQRQRAAAR